MFCEMKSQQPPNQEHIDGNMVKMEVNLDDISGEWLGFVMDVLLDAGANDVYYTSIYMKKNRPGILLQLLCTQQEVKRMKEIILRETTTLGIRYYPLTVHRMERHFLKVDTKWGSVRIKQGINDGYVFQSSPEFEDCKAIAEQQHIPLKSVYKEVWKQLAKYDV